jgi:hypothetical protein
MGNFKRWIVGRGDTEMRGREEPSVADFGVRLPADREYGTGKVGRTLEA